MDIKRCLPWLLVLSLTVVVGYVRCDDESNNAIADSDDQLNNRTREVITSGLILSSLSFNFLLATSKPSPENIIFAPINIVKTLATILLGAAGDTETELAYALGWISGTDLINKLNVVHEIFGALITEISKYPGTEVGTNLHIAGALFVQKDHPIRQKYLELAKSIYQTEVMNLDFKRDPVGATKIVNNWINNKTNGMITELLEDPVDTSTVVLPAGSLYFNGNWEYPFNEKVTRSQPFFLGSEGKFSKNRVMVKMMVNTATVPYFEDRSLGFTSIGLPYKGKDIYMYVLLPKINFSLHKFAMELSLTDIKNVLTASKPMETMYVIPKMKLSSKINLRDITKRMNVKSIFNPATANFSNLADGVYVSDILHQVEIEVNEIGTVAAAATAGTVSRGAMNIFRADRPFLFFIHNVRVNVVTFWAAINKPTPYEKP